MGKSSIIAVLRHADYHQPLDVPSATLPYPLTEQGKLQAKSAAKGILDFCNRHNLEIDTVIDTSRMLRAYQTGSLISEVLKHETGLSYELTEYSELAERSVGAVANLTVTQIEKLLEQDPRYASPPPDWKSSSYYSLPFQGAESLINAGARVAAYFQKLADKLGGSKNPHLKIVVGHGAAIRHAAVHLALLNLNEAANFSMHHASALYLYREDNYRWTIVEGYWKLRNKEYDTAID